MDDPGKRPTAVPPPASAAIRKLRFDAPHPRPAPPHRPARPPGR